MLFSYILANIFISIFNYSYSMIRLSSATYTVSFRTRELGGIYSMAIIIQSKVSGLSMVWLIPYHWYEEKSYFKRWQPKQTHTVVWIPKKWNKVSDLICKNNIWWFNLAILKVKPKMHFQNFSWSWSIAFLSPNIISPIMILRIPPEQY